jgi:hypothetical protein
MPHRGSSLLAAGALAMLAFTGVSCSQSETLNPVQGKVLHQGQPLAGALVSFHPDSLADGTLADAAVGLSKADGTFELATGQASGAHAGKYTVTVICPVPIESQQKGMSFGGEPETEDKLKGAYANRETSQIKIQIKEGPNQLEPIELK